MRRTVLTMASLLLLACGDDGGGTGGSTGDPSTGAATTSETESSGSTGSSTGTTTDPSGTSSGPGSTSSVDSSSGGSSSDTGEGLCPDLGDPCTQCEATMCPDEYCGCFDNGSCGLLAQCAAGCEIGDAECNQACWTMHPEGISDGALLTHCAATLCMPECGPFVPLTECQVCLYSECQDAMNVCVSNPECTALLECLDACENPGCENGCYALHPDGFADSGPVGECAQRACLTACA